MLYQQSNKSKSNSLKQWIVTIVCLIPILLYFFMPASKEKTILILGDSLSYPYGIGPKDSWVELLQQRLNKENYHYKLIDSSIPGDVTEGGLERLPRNLKDDKPVLTIIEMGANDAIQGLPIATIKDHLRQLIRLAKKANSKVLLLGMHMLPNNTIEYQNNFRQIYPELAREEHVTLVPLFLKDVESNPRLMQEDKLHPIKEAQPMLLETIWPFIKKLIGPPASVARPTNF